MRSFAALLAIGIVAFAATAKVAWERDCIANPDEAAYLEQARSLLRGDGLEVGFVRFFHERYPRDVVHPEDFYPPGNGALLAAAIATAGDTEFAAALPSALLACLVLPLLVFALVRRLGAGAPAFAFGAGLLVMFDPLVRAHALQGLADLPLTTAAAAAVLLALSGTTTTALLAGAAAAAGFYFKPAALLFLPGFALLFALCSDRPLAGLLRRGLPFLLVFLAVIAPWLLRNAALFGDPLYSGNQHLSAIANDPAFRYEDIRKVFFADPGFHLPSLAGGVAEFGVAAVASRFLLHVYQCVVEHAEAFGAWFVAGAVFLFRARAVLAVALVVATYALSLCAVFAIEPRYLMPVTPLCIAVAWAFGARLAAALREHEAFGAAARFVPRTASAAAVVLAVAGSLPGIGELARDVALGRPAYAPRGDESIRDAALWAREHLPAGSRVMNQEALRFRAYSGRIAVNTPFDVPERIHAVVEAYAIDVIVQNDAGNYADFANRYLAAYFAAFGEQWTALRPDGASFVVHRRSGSGDSGR